MALIQKLAKETLIYGISNILFKVINFLFFTVYLTRRFPDAAEFAVHGLFYSFIAFIYVFYTFRMETAFFRFAAKEDNSNKAFSTASGFLLLTSILFSTILYFSADYLSGWVTAEGDVRYIYWFMIIATFDALVAIPFAKMRLQNQPIKFAMYKALNALLGILIAVVFLELIPWGNHQGWWELQSFIERAVFLDWVFIANILASAIIFLLLSSEYFKSTFEFDFDLLKKMLRYSWPLVIVGLAGVINQLFDRVFIKELAGFEASGIYNGAIKIAILMNLFSTAFNYAAEPFFFKRMKQVDAKQIYAKVAQAFALAGSLVFAGILLYMDLVQHLIGRNYREGLIIIPYALMGYFFLGLYYNFSIWYKIKDRTTVGALIGLGGMAITIVLNLLLIPQLGIVGSAVTLMACFGFMAIVGWATGRKYYPVPYDLKRILAYIFSAVAIYGLSILWTQWLSPTVLWSTIGNTLLLLLACGILYLVDRKNLRELFTF